MHFLKEFFLRMIREEERTDFYVDHETERQEGVTSQCCKPRKAFVNLN